MLCLLLGLLPLLLGLLLNDSLYHDVDGMAPGSLWDLRQLLAALVLHDLAAAKLLDLCLEEWHSQWATLLLQECHTRLHLLQQLSLTRLLLLLGLSKALATCGFQLGNGGGCCEGKESQDEDLHGG